MPPASCRLSTTRWVRVVSDGDEMPSAGTVDRDGAPRSDARRVVRRRRDGCGGNMDGHRSGSGMPHAHRNHPDRSIGAHMGACTVSWRCALLAACSVALLTGSSLLSCSTERDARLEAADTRAVGAQLEAYLDRAAEVWGFQGAALVASGDTLLLAQGYGSADLAGRRPITPETKFMIGSLTKPFTAILTLQLAGEGRIDLQAPIGAYLSDYPSPAAEHVTLHHLLSHSSGIPDLPGNAAFRARITEAHTPDALIAYFRDAPLQFPPGARSAYASANYVLLGRIAEEVTGRSWEALIRERICEPLGLVSTGVYPDYASRTDFAAGVLAGPDGSLRPAPPLHPSCGYAAGALASSVRDLLLLHRALASARLLPRETITAMESLQAPPFGYGWLLSEPGGHALVAHGGGLPGYSAILHRWTADSLCVAILGHRPSVPLHSLALSLAAIVFGADCPWPAAREPIALAPQTLGQYAGCYAIGDGGERCLEPDGGALLARRDGGTPYRLLAEARDRFRYAHDPLTYLHFERDDGGRIIGHTLRQAFHEEYARRIP
ncbi:MAG: serine hydrolase [Candidatus Eisenbacteria bacterium]|nr:serine hydrolase [Candidatus Eisenbacteria bacterium]